MSGTSAGGGRSDRCLGRFGGVLAGFDGVTYSTLNPILVYLADNYGQDSASCDMEAVKIIPGLLN